MTLVDSGPLIALVIRNDAQHTLCVQTLPLTTEPRITTHAVLAEAMHFAGDRVGWHAQAKIWELVNSGGLIIAALTNDHRLRMQTLMEKYRDVPMDFADASLVAVAESLDTTQIFTLDSDFTFYRLNDKQPFEIVP
jgi:predicted nucleic acid-binding protein